MKTKFFFYFFFILIASIFSSYEKMNFERLPGTNEYSKGFITSIIEDRMNMIWFGTPTGLLRFDGQNFKDYNHDNNKYSMSNNYIKVLFLNKSETLWIGTVNGLNRFDFKTERFYVFKNNKEDHFSLSHNNINVIFEDSKKYIWVGTFGGGLNKFNPKTGKFQRFIYSPEDKFSISNNNVTSIIEDKNNQMWIGTLKGLNRLDSDKNKFKRYLKENPEHSIIDNHVNTIIKSKGKIYIGTRRGGISVYNAVNDTFESLKLFKNQESLIVKNIFEDNGGKFWVGTSNHGIFLFDKHFKNQKNCLFKMGDLQSLISNKIKSIFQDSSGIVWIGTFKGINKFNERKNVFNYYNHNPYIKNSLNDESVYAMCKDSYTNDVIWVGTGSGLDKINVKKNEFEHYKHIKDNPYSLSNNDINCLLKDRKKRLWVGTFNGLNLLKNDSMTFKRFFNAPNVKNCLSNNRVFSVFEDNEGRIWIGTLGGGLNLYNEKKENFLNFVYKKNTINSISSNRIYCILEKKKEFKNILWIGTYSGGLNKFDIKSNKFKVYKVNEDNNSISDNTIRVIYEDKKGILWLGTDNGLNRFNPIDDSFIHYLEKDGLSNNKVYGIIEDDDGFLWISTNKGLSRFNKNNYSFKNFDSNDGLMVNYFQPNASLKNNDGKIYFGGVNGMISFYPSRIKKNLNIPTIVITNFKIFNEPVKIGDKLKSSILNTDEIVLDYKDSIFSFEFAALDYTTPEKNQYAYKMKGLTDKWIYIGNKKDITFTDLSPGHYTFRVKGSNNDGVWNETGASVKIYIAPPLWLTWWAYILYVFTIIMFFLIWHKIRVRQLKKRKRELIDEVEKRTAELEAANLEINVINDDLGKSMLNLSKMNSELKEANQLKSEFLGIAAHDLKNPLQVILGYADILRMKLKKENKDIKEIKKINQSVEKMLDLITDLLKTASLETGQLELNFERIDLGELIENVVENNRTIAAKKNQKINYSKVDDIFIKGDSSKMVQVFDNLISNGIKYSLPDKDIDIIIGIEKDEAIVHVKDDGPGFTEEDKKNLFKKFQRLSAKPTAGESSTGLGLSICKGFVERHSGKLYVESELGKGSTFIVKLPLFDE